MHSFDPQRWLPTMVARPAARWRLVCFPYAGGGATVFRSWHRVWEDTEVRALQLPARQERLMESGVTSVERIVDAVDAALAALPPLPTAFYGHSFGGLVAYEVTRRLAALQRAPFALVVGGRRAPHLPRRESDLSGLPDSAFISRLDEVYASTLGATVRENPDLLALVMPSLRADFTAFEAYVPVERSPLHVPVTVLRGLNDARVTESDAAGWQQSTSRHLVVHTVDAGHFFLESHGSWAMARTREALVAAAAS